MFAEVEIEEIVEKLKKASQAYYGGKPIMSDPEYDALERRLRELDPENEFLQQVGADIPESTFAKVEHAIPMLSLNKAYSLEEVVSWRPASKAIGMPKMDGFAVAIHYRRDGKVFRLAQGLTRGKGKHGEDITQNVLQIKDIPHEIEGNLLKGLDAFEVRGECYMKHSTFVRLGLDKEYENCRNIAPGSVRQKDPRVTKARELNFFAYNLLSVPEADTMVKRLDTAQAMGFIPVWFREVNLESEEEIQAVWKYLEDTRSVEDFDMDGVVYMLDDCAEIEKLGNTSHHPRAAIAWKFEAEEGESTLNGCQFQVGRTGVITPVGLFNDVRLDGATLSQASLCNLSELERLGIGIGDRVVISRRGGVIPKIERVLKSEGKGLQIPDKCPVCGEKTEVRVANTKDQTKTLHCVNPDCPAVTLTRIHHFVKVMEIEDVAESMLTKLMDANYVETAADLFLVTKEQLLTLPGVKARTADRYIQNVNAARKRPLGQFLASLGIRTLGKNVSESVADTMGTLAAVLAAKESDFSAIEKIGPEIARNTYEGLKANSDLIQALTKQIEVAEKQETGESTGALAGKSFLITGTLSMGRKAFEQMIKDNGGEIRSSVSKTLSYLVVGDAPGGKLGKAQKAGVEIITEEQFNVLLGR